jgi:surface protein
MKVYCGRVLPAIALIVLMFPTITGAQTYVYRTTADNSPMVVSAPAGDGTGGGAENCSDAGNIGLVGQAGWSGCAGMLIVNTAMLKAAASPSVGGNGSFGIEGPDGITYTFGNSVHNVYTGQVTDMQGLFSSTSFNADIGYWDTSKVTTMHSMFQRNPSFNQPISGWDTSNVLLMGRMFGEATAFNQDLSGWCVTNIPAKPSFFDTIASSWGLPRPVWGTCPGN